MKISRPVWSFITSSLVFAISFFAAVWAASGSLKIQFESLPRRVCYFSGLALAAVAIIWMLASFIWWVVIEMRARRGVRRIIAEGQR